MATSYRLAPSPSSPLPWPQPRDAYQASKASGSGTTESAVQLMNHRLTPHEGPRLLAGFCGALTTSSTYSMDTVRMLQKHQFCAAACYVAASNVLAIGAAGAGFAVGSYVKRPLPGVLIPKLPFRGLQVRPTKPPNAPPK